MRNMNLINIRIKLTIKSNRNRRLFNKKHKKAHRLIIICELNSR